MKELQNFNSSNNNKLLVCLPINKMEDFPLNECLYSIAQQNQPVDLLVLTNNLSIADTEYLTKILNSPKIVLTEKDDKGEITRREVNALKDINYIIRETQSINFQQVFNESFNYAVDNKYEWYSIIEHDDTVDTKWYEKAFRYAKSKPDVDIFLPLTREVSNGVFLGYFNEACWVEGYAEFAGFYDLQLLLRFNCTNITGAIFKVESIKNKSENKNSEYKPIKESMKIGYSYEFFLRMIYEDIKTYSIPRVGYEHRIDRPMVVVNYFSSKLPRDLTSKPDSQGGITTEEQSFWLAQARKEYFHEEDRNIQYIKK